MAEQLLYATVRMEVDHHSDETSQGTAFLFNMKHKDNTMPFLITNQNVFGEGRV